MYILTFENVVIYMSLYKNISLYYKAKHGLFNSMVQTVSKEAKSTLGTESG